VEVKIITVSSPEFFGPVRIEQGNVIKRGIFQYMATQFVKIMIPAFQKNKNIQQCHGSRTFVTMHLRPQHNLCFPVSAAQPVDTSPFYRRAEFTDRKNIAPFPFAYQGFDVAMRKYTFRNTLFPENIKG